MKVLGIDIGTQGTRALVIDERGQILAAATEEHEAFQSPQTGWAEQRPEDWWRACTAAVRKVLPLAGVTGNEIGSVGFSGQMHGAVLLDEAGVPVRNALIWCDQRTEKQARELTERIGSERLVQLVSNPALTCFTLTKILWVREHEPKLWARVKSVLLPKDYVRFRLTGERVCEVSDASGTLLLDVRSRQWSKPMREAAQLDASLLPPLYESQEIAGRVSAAAADITGLRVGTPVVAGAGDQAAGAVGMGIVTAGSVSSTIGTSGVVFAATDEPFLDPGGRLHTFCHAIPGRWHVMGVTQAAGLSLRWFRDQFGGSYDTLTTEAAAVPVGSDGLLFTPYLMGERTPHLDPTARGAFVGLTASHTRGHLVRAILEGVAFSLRDSVQIFEDLKIPLASIRLGGGGARSALWREIQAGVFGRDVETVTAEEGAALGAAILAGVGGGLWSSVDDACAAVVHTAERVTPSPAATELYRGHYASYRRVYAATRSVFTGKENNS